MIATLPTPRASFLITPATGPAALGDVCNLTRPTLLRLPTIAAPTTPRTSIRTDLLVEVEGRIITRRQHVALVEIRAYAAKHGRWPTFIELGRQLEIARQSAGGLVGGLVAAGLVAIDEKTIVARGEL